MVQINLEALGQQPEASPSDIARSAVDRLKVVAEGAWQVNPKVVP